MSEPLVIKVPTKRTSYVAVDSETNEVIAHGEKIRQRQARTKLIFLFVAVLFFGLLISIQAELLPTSGKFKGIYHKDRFGSRHFLFFDIPEALHSAFDKHNGKFIEVEIKKGEQLICPGNVTILELGKIVRLTQPEIKITVKTVPENITHLEPFQALMLIENRGDEVLKLQSPGNILLRSDPEITSTNQPYQYFHKSFHFRNLVKSIIWRRHHILGHPADSASKIQLLPGETMPCVVSFDKGLAKGKYELEAFLRVGNSEPRISVADWISFDIDKNTGEERKTNSNLKLTHSSFKSDTDWISVQLLLSNEGSEERSIPQLMDDGKFPLWSGKLYGYTEDGTEIPLTFNYPFQNAMGPPDGFWKIAAISRKGLKMSMQFRPESWFPPAPLKKLKCKILTDNGLESFTITNSFQDKVFTSLPSFGKTVNGIKCRIRTQKQLYTQDESIRIYWQVVNIDQVPVVLSGDDGWEIRIDGKIIRSRYKDVVWGWAMTQGPYRPDEHYINLKDLKLSPGKHSIQLICKGSASHYYKNANGKMIPVFKGTLKSNIFNFVVDKK